ncbi:CLUMA_CG018688, isoform A [Clunio marinus]|uniref:CLUMA_CG018688, isoform A n=1 Tax=Clunio marinus TaxID=568069 RepID=A0A1J1J1L9_9DIPT|nr:CLUMA_CG018688, isoform A [Clunio marinus]
MFAATTREQCFMKLIHKHYTLNNSEISWHYEICIEAICCLCDEKTQHDYAYLLLSNEMFMPQHLEK